MERKYEFLVWRDQSGICFKFGYSYGIGCWKTVMPRKRPYYFIIPIFSLTPASGLKFIDRETE